MPDHQIASALGTKLVERDVGNLLALIQTTGGLAVRIACARHELAEAATLQHHDPPTVLAIFFLGSFLDVRGIQIRQVDWIFFGESAAFGIFFVV